MNTRAPRFSIVMPAYNAEATIDAAIESVIGQRRADWELIIIDDGSTDGTRTVADRYAQADARVSVYSQANAGTGAAITAGVERATGEFIVQLGADDELLPDYCLVTGDFIDANPGYDIYASNAFRLLPGESRELYHTSPRFSQEMELTVDDLLDAALIYGTAAFRRQYFDKVGGFRGGYYNEDYDFWLRIMMAGARHIYTPRPLALYRVTAGQKTEDGVRMRLEDIRILRDAVQSGGLTLEQVAHAERTIRLLERNVAFRRAVSAVFGRRLAAPVFRLAHRMAWLVRPHRRR